MKAIKLDEKAIVVALQYGKTVNRGIIEMEKSLRSGNQQVTEKVPMGNPAVTFDEEYWNHMEALLKKYQKGEIQKPLQLQSAPKESPFKTGLQIKTIGKIDPEEQLQEPVGRQGREVR